MYVPKIFHFIWVGDKKVPLFVHKCIKSWLKHHPDWKVMIWDNERVQKTFLDENAPYFLFNEQLYLNTKLYAQKADLLRLEILFWFGGVYIDSDFWCSKNIEELIQGLKSFSAWSCKRDNEWIDTGIIGSIPNCKPIWKAIIQVGINLSKKPNLEIISATGPGAITKVWKTDSKVAKLPSKYFYPFSVVFDEEFEGFEAYPEAYAIHLFLQSYREGERFKELETFFE